MGYSTITHPGGSYENFRPDDTENEFYIERDTSLSNLMTLCAEKWPGLDLAQIEIRAEYIHTECLGYDKYDAGDYTTYLCIKKLA